MKVQFWGVRGCIPAPGPEFVRYGGNTTCVSVQNDDDLIILDAGTGIIELGRALMQREFGTGSGHASLFLTHAHWDHIQGFPFFVPIFVPGNHVDIYGSTGSPAMLESILEGQMDPYYMPIQSLKNLGAALAFHHIDDREEHRVGQTRVRACAVPHGRVTALAIRIDASDRSLVFLPDVGYADSGPSTELCALVDGVDLLIHDCTYSPADYETRAYRGYSSYVHAARLAASCGVGKLVMFHYDQDYSDAQVDELQIACRELLDTLGGGPQVALEAAREGLALTLP